MTKIIRWNQVKPVNLFEEFDRVFNQPATRWQNEWRVAVDVAENEDAYVVKASLPGIDADNVDLMIEDNVLSIKGEVKSDETIADEQYHVRERHYGNFSRSIRFPVAVNGSDVEATYENGVLVLTVPKAEEVKPKRIQIKY